MSKSNDGKAETSRLGPSAMRSLMTGTLGTGQAVLRERSGAL